MKQFIILLFLLILLDRISGQTYHHLTPEWGMVKYGDTILIDETEIS